MSKEPLFLDIDAPIASLRALTEPTADELAARKAARVPVVVEGDGITASELARRAGVTRMAVYKAEQSADGISLGNLRRYVEACGHSFVVGFKEK